ncbi:MAG: HNH endonuclease [Anaerolineae bacterium]|nr:HNH endonuclease [Anaerolineae bacterium]
MTYVSEALRRFVTERAFGRCEYCQSPKMIVVTMVLDHIIPVAAGGATIPENLCLTCVGCNLFKSDFEVAVDPLSQQGVPLYNPRDQVWDEHFAWSPDGTLIEGVTAIGRATIERLQMNRTEVVRARQMWVKAGWHPPQRV